MAKFDFDLEMGGDLPEMASRAARAADHLADELARLDKQQDKTARHAIMLAKAHAKVADEAYQAARAQRKAGRSMDPRDTLRAARASSRLAEAQSKFNRVSSQNPLMYAGGGGLMGATKMLGGIGAALGAVTIAYGAAKVAAYGFGKAVDLTEAVVDMAMFAESTKLAFSNLRGGEALGVEAFDKSRKLAVQLGEEVDVTSERMMKLLAMQFSLEEATGLVKMVADLKTIGVHGEKADRVLTALTQIRAKGRLQAEEMLQLAEAGISLELVYGALQKQTGKTRDEIMKLQKAGKLGAGLALDAVQEAVLKKVGKHELGVAGEQFADQMLQGMRNRLQGSKKLFLMDLAENLDIGPLGAMVKDLAGVLGDKTLSAGFASGIGRIGGFIDRIRPDVVNAFAKGLKIAGDAFDKLVLVAGEFTDGFLKEVSPALDRFSGVKFDNVDQLGKLAGIAGAEAGKMATDFLDFGAKAIPVLDRTVSVLERILDLFGKVGGDKEKTSGEGGSVVSSFVGGMLTQSVPAIGQAYQLGGAIGDALSGGTKDALQQHSPSRVGIDIGKTFDKSIAMGVTANDNAFKASVGLGDRMSSAFSMPAARPSFQGSPAQRAMSSTSNVVNFQQRNSIAINEAESGSATGAAVGSALFDFSIGARNKFAVGIGLGR